MRIPSYSVTHQDKNRFFERRIARTVRLLQNAMMPSETQILPAKGTSAQNLIFLLLCAGFVLNGIVICLIGPLLPLFREKWALDDSHAVLFSTMQFAFSLAGRLLSSQFVSAHVFTASIVLA